ncbi:chemotaxis protein CheA [Liquorilactobacillus ghanensis DSM 18630]|uniref:Chemotaxis protein CheA n=2 Tax=Liquorilactobacillus ghanensis TaxID=399370 RepID=A0A0R1VK86_9LACO|nr:chemotaxis protein CheA [Liquorilactobacillus ghanensis]AJA33984.1 two-component system chemotaxis family sensor kinase CheA [Liquorilactobacillus ghanensis]KRM05975.1 chemotaxis protein CheA [Liquorilactobacillus ghanensis DSM 18630]
MDDNSAYRDLFFEESEDNLQQLNDNVLELEKEPDNIDLINEIFRAAHTLKGSSATMGYEVMTKLTHRMEDIFDLFKSGKLKVNGDHISLIFKCLDRLSQLLDDLRDEKDLSEDQIKDLIDELNKVETSATGKAAETVPAAAEADQPAAPKAELTATFSSLEDADVDVAEKAKSGGQNVFTIAIRLDAETLLKGPRVFLIMQKLEEEGDVIHTEPTADLLEDGKFDTDFKLVFVTRETQDDIKKNVESNSELEKAIVEPFDAKKAVAAQKEAEEAAEKQPAKTAAPKAAAAKPAPKKAAAKKPAARAKSSHHNARNQSIRVDLSRLDRFLNLVSELVVYRNQMEDSSHRSDLEGIRDSLEQVSRLTSELQDLVLRIRMQQVSVVFSRFPRMIRDLGRTLHKDMDLVVIGEDTELDKTVVSELGEPMIHMLRNSADHGIEDPDTREKLGKPRKGTITLSAYQEGNRVIITLEDDGKGIDPQVIKASAESKGINTDGMSEDELKHLIFHPGFSTAKKITDISGRGVGLDAVQSKINELGGSIELRSQVNVGSKFIIKLPLTLSIIQALMVKVGAGNFAIPLDVVERVVMLHDEDIVPTAKGEVYRFQDTLIPIVRTDKLLNIKTKEGAKKFAIIVKSDQQYFGILADQLIGQKEIVIKKIDPVLQKINRYQGATIFDNGSIALILDVNALCQTKKGTKS